MTISLLTRQRQFLLPVPYSGASTGIHGCVEQMQFSLLVQQRCCVMAELAERHEIQIRGHGGTIVFTADSEDGRLVIRQIPEGWAHSDWAILEGPVRRPRDSHSPHLATLVEQRGGSHTAIMAAQDRDPVHASEA
jgi:hypothetical protein